MYSQKVSQFAKIVSGPGADAWEIHRLGKERIDAGEDVLLLTIGEDVGAVTPTDIVETAVSSLRDGRHHYPAVEGMSSLRTAIADRHAKTTGQQVNADNVVVFAGAQNALFATALCLLDPGDEVIVIEPYYSTYPATFSAIGSSFVSVAADASRGLIPDIDKLREAITKSTRLLVINSPNNPTGAVYPRDCLETILQICRENDCWLLSDEVYADFIYDGNHESVASMCSADDQLVVVSSLSKSHRMAGWRTGWAIAPLQLAAHFTDLNLSMLYGLPPFIQDAAEFAIRNSQHTPVEMAADYAARARRVLAALDGIGEIDVVPAQAGMFLLLDVSPMKISGHEFASRLLKESGVAILPCASFGTHLDSYLRMSLCTDNDGLDRACAAIVKLARA